MTRYARLAETLYPDWVRVVTYGDADAGSYELMADAGVVLVSRVGQTDRRYRVRCVAGKPTACDCPAGRWGKACKHKAILAGLIARRQFVMDDDRETVTDVAAVAEEKDAFYDRGPDRMADDAEAEEVGRRIMAAV